MLWWVRLSDDFLSARANKAKINELVHGGSTHRAHSADGGTTRRRTSISNILSFGGSISNKHGGEPVCAKTRRRGGVLPGTS